MALRSGKAWSHQLRGKMWIAHQATYVMLQQFLGNPFFLKENWHDQVRPHQKGQNVEGLRNIPWNDTWETFGGRRLFNWEVWVPVVPTCLLDITVKIDNSIALGLTFRVQNHEWSPLSIQMLRSLRLQMAEYHSTMDLFSLAIFTFTILRLIISSVSPSSTIQ